MRGGKRPNAGRKSGQRNKRTKETIAKAAAAGLLPHEFLAAVQRGEVVDGVTPSFEQRLDAAKAAAPYFAPKLANIDATLKGKDGQSLLAGISVVLVKPVA